MAATLFVCRGRRSNRNIFDIFKLLEYGYSISFGVKEKAKRGPYPNLMRVHNYATKSEKAEKQHLKRGRIIKEGAGEFPKLLFTGNRDYLIKYNGQQIFRSVATINKASSHLRASPQGDRAYFHTTRVSSRSHKILPNLKRGDKMKFELRIDNTRSGFGMHYIVPVEIKGKKVVKLYNNDLDFVLKWLPYTTSIVKNQPAKLRDLMDRYWLSSPDEDNDYMRASVMLRYGVHPQDFVPHFDNYWEDARSTLLEGLKLKELNLELDLQKKFGLFGQLALATLFGP